MFLGGPSSLSAHLCALVSHLFKLGSATSVVMFRADARVPQLSSEVTMVPPEGHLGVIPTEPPRPRSELLSHGCAQTQPE